MIRRSFVLGAAAATLAVGGCSYSSPTPTPTPTPTSTPTPTPTPVVYATFPLTAAAQFNTLDAFTSYTGDITAGPITLGSAGSETTSARVNLAVLSDPTTASATAPEVIDEGTGTPEEVRFVTAPTVAPATTVNEYVFDSTGGVTPGQFNHAEYLNNVATLASNPATKVITADPLLGALTEVSYTGWSRGDSTTGGHRITYGVWGYPTVVSDVPTTGTFTYSADIAGRAVAASGTTALTRLGGTVTITVNFATGVISFTANVTTVTGGVSTPFGTYSGTGALAVGSNVFTGSFGPTSPIPGTVSGGFFGSQGTQIGLSFAGSGPIGGIDTRIVGAIVGKQN